MTFRGLSVGSGDLARWIRALCAIRRYKKWLTWVGRKAGIKGTIPAIEARLNSYIFTTVFLDVTRAFFHLSSNHSLIGLRNQDIAWFLHKV